MVAWFTKNGVAANLLMGFIVLLGFYALQKIPTEFFPEFELDLITVSVPYRGATPAEVEEAVIIRVEEAIQDLEGIKEIISIANEGSASIRIEVQKGYETRELLDDIKNRVDAIITFPEDVEKPIISQVNASSTAISVVIGAQMAEKDLRQFGEKIRDEIAGLKGITQANLFAIRPYEVSIEISEYQLERYNLTMEMVSRAVASTSLDLPAGSIKTKGGDILLRTKGQAYQLDDFENIPLVKRSDGTLLLLKDIAKVKDGFEETPLFARFNGKPCVLVNVYRVGEQNVITLAQQVKDYIKQKKETLPEEIELTYWLDSSKIVKGRLKTLVDSAKFGGLLVFIILALFLRLSLALWVCIGIPVSFLGAIALMPTLGVTMNIMSLFAFILVLGIVVDDAIVVGENIFSHLQKESDSEKAAINGAREVAVPVTFGILTTVIAFVPLALIDGARGKIFLQIPAIVIPVLLFSLVESKIILPAHLKHLKGKGNYDEKANLWSSFQSNFSNGLVWLIKNIYEPFLEKVLKFRYFSLSVFISALILIVSLVASGRVRFIYFPKVQSERATASLTMPTGIPVETTARYVRLIEKEAWKIKNKYKDQETGESVIKNIMTTVGDHPFGRRGGSSAGASHLGGVVFEIVAPEDRKVKITSWELVKEWRNSIGIIPGAKDLNFKAEIGHGGSPIDIQLTGKNFQELSVVSERIKQKMAEFDGLFDITDSFEDGKQEVKLKLKPEAKNLGLSLLEIGRQVRNAFFGRLVQRIQRGRDDVRVLVRYPFSERQSIENLETMKITTATGERIPLETIASIERGFGFSSIRRVNRDRALNVRSDVDKIRADLRAIKSELTEYVEELLKEYSGISYTFEGEAREQQEAFSSLIIGGAIVLFAIYGMLAVPLGSYIQPFIIMSVIPFGLLGAVLGHMIMGMTMSIMSIFGMLALAGVVVNDSLVLVDYVNKSRSKKETIIQAVRHGGGARFRAILLTSLTTFFGLVPLILEKSTQAQFLIPMAVSLGFGILFATIITLLLVPINYLIIEDLKSGFKKVLFKVGFQKKSGTANLEAA